MHRNQAGTPHIAIAMWKEEQGRSQGIDGRHDPSLTTAGAGLSISRSASNLPSETGNLDAFT